MKFSLVLCTVGRTEELERFLSSLARQSHTSWELIIVDQNPDERLACILERYGSLAAIRRIRSEKGLSRARNAGLRYVSGDVIAFPDDDCWYPPGLLENVSRILSEHPECDGVTGRPVDEVGTSSRWWDRRPGFLTPQNSWHRAISYSIFLRRKVVDAIGKFDESLGVGAGTPWGAGEETDYLLNAIDRGFSICYNPTLAVNHPVSPAPLSAGQRRKAYSYAMGIGRVVRKHEYSAAHDLYWLLRPLAGILYSLVILNVPRGLHRWALFRGQIRGYFAPHA